MLSRCFGRGFGWWPVLALLALAASLACGQAAASPGAQDVAVPPVPSGSLKVVSTVSPITSLVENVGGTRIALEGVVPEGTNSHTFEPAPSVASTLTTADLFVANGLFLEEPVIAMARANLNPGAVILTLGDQAITRDEWVFDLSFPESGGHPNPHLWTAPHLAKRYAQLIHEQLVALDPDNAEYFTDNLRKLEERLDDLDRRIALVVDTIPPEHRKLLTYHDSFPVFAQRYGFEIIGAVQPSDFSEPSAREVAGLINQVRDSGVPAIFGSEVFPSPVMEAVARESGAVFVDDLRDDDLPGAPGGARHTYMGLMLADLEAMAPALGGNIEAFEGFDPGLVFDGPSPAVYPQ
jgi:ABC-type Zn uptake system ZnuABC Zn-binding protein ZnuA